MKSTSILFFFHHRLSGTIRGNLAQVQNVIVFVTVMKIDEIIINVFIHFIVALWSDIQKKNSS